VRAQSSRALARSVLVAGSFALAASCRNSPAQRLAETLDEAAGQLAVLDMGLAAWFGNRVPTAFLERLADETASRLEQAASSATALPSDRALGDSARRTLEHAASAASLASLVRSADTNAIRSHAAQLSTLRSTIGALRSRVSPEP
jgi:hypothetical protein